MAFEEMEVVVDVADQAGLARQQEHGAEAAGTEALHPIGQLVMDVGCGHHGLIAFRTGAIHDAIEHPWLAFPKEIAVSFSRRVAVAFWGLLGDSRSHSKASVSWNSDGILTSQLFQKLRGFSSFFRDF